MANPRAPRTPVWTKKLRTGYATLPATLPPSGSVPDNGPTGAIGLTVELLLGATGWTDISDFVYYRDGTDKITITRGRLDETSNAQPQTATLTLNNRDGRFSPRNPLGPYYGLIGRNTPIRISRLQNGVRRYRFAGEVPSWPTDTDISATDIYTTITAHGMLRRLQQGTPLSQSALYRAYTKGFFEQIPSSLGAYDIGENVPNVVAYWPCEDAIASGSLASALSGGAPITFSGSPTLSSDSSFVASASIPVLNGSTWTATAPTGMTWTDNVVRFLMHIPSGGDTNGAVLARVFTTGTAHRVDLTYTTTSGGALTLTGFKTDGTTAFTLGPFSQSVGVGWNGLLERCSIALRTSGANVEYEFQALKVGDSASGSTSGTLSSATLGAVTSVVVNPAGGMTGTSIGHISIQNVWDTLDDLLTTLDGWLGEETDRLVRLCQEEGVNQYTVYGVPNTEFGHGDGRGFDYPSGMGNQLPGTFLGLVQQCIDVDAGILFEARDQVALLWRTRPSLYNQGTVYGLSPFQVTLDYAQSQLSATPLPQDDDYFTRNDVVVQQINGTSARQYLSDGTALSISAPPAGVGEYATSYSLNICNDGTFTGQMTIADHAGWRLHLGTVDEPRYPQISVNLRATEISSNLDLVNALLAVDVGDVIAIDNPPQWLPPDQVRQIIQGYSESLGVFEHDIMFNCSPESPYRVMIADDWTLSRADTDGSTLRSDITSTQVKQVYFTTTSATSPQWTNDPQSFPFDVEIGGERVTVVCPGDSKVNDPFFANGAGNYSANNGSLVYPSDRPFPVNADGVLEPFAQTLELIPTGGFASVYVLSDNSSAGSVIAGTSYTAWGWIYSQSGHQYQAFINWALDGVYDSTTLGTAITVPHGTWTFLTVVGTAPASTDMLSVGINDATGSPTNGQNFKAYGLNCTPTQYMTQTSPQRYTVIRSVNGVVKAQSAGTDVRLFQPTILSL